LARKTQSPGKGKNGFSKEVGYINPSPGIFQSTQGRFKGGFREGLRAGFNRTNQEQKGNNSRH